MGSETPSGASIVAHGFGMTRQRKTCSSCRKRRAISQFSSNGKGGYRTVCRDCIRHADRAYRYGISVEEFDALFAAQGGACAVCFEPFDDETPCVDHDHSCCPGRIGCGSCNRGLLCHRCNKMLGLIGDDETIAERTVEYLTREYDRRHEYTTE